MAFDIKQFKKQLQEDVEKQGRDVNLTLITRMVLGEPEVQELFKQHGIDLDTLKKGLALELKQDDQARDREEKRKEEEYDSSDYEKKKSERRWEKANAESLHRFIDAVELRATIEGRPISPVDVIKEMAMNMQDTIHGGVVTFQIMNVDLEKIFPDIPEKSANLKLRNRAVELEHSVAEQVKTWKAVVEGLLTEYPKLRDVLGSAPGKFTQREQARQADGEQHTRGG